MANTRRNTYMYMDSVEDPRDDCAKYCEQTTVVCGARCWCLTLVLLVITTILSTTLFIYFRIQPNNVHRTVEDPGWFLAATGQCSRLTFNESTETPGFVGRIAFHFSTSDLIAFRDFPSHQSHRVPPGGIPGSIDDLTSMLPGIPPGGTRCD